MQYTPEKIMSKLGWQKKVTSQLLKTSLLQQHLLSPTSLLFSSQFHGLFQRTFSPFESTDPLSLFPAPHPPQAVPATASYFAHRRWTCGSCPAFLHTKSASTTLCLGQLPHIRAPLNKGGKCSLARWADGLCRGILSGCVAVNYVPRYVIGQQHRFYGEKNENPNMPSETSLKARGPDFHMSKGKKE